MLRKTLAATTVALALILAPGVALADDGSVVVGARPARRRHAARPPERPRRRRPVQPGPVPGHLPRARPLRPDAGLSHPSTPGGGPPGRGRHPRPHAGHASRARPSGRGNGGPMDRRTRRGWFSRSGRGRRRPTAARAGPPTTARTRRAWASTSSSDPRSPTCACDIAPVRAYRPSSEGGRYNFPPWGSVTSSAPRSTPVVTTRCGPGLRPAAAPECGVVCQGLFDGCADVWARGPRPVTIAATRAVAGVARRDRLLAWPRYPPASPGTRLRRGAPSPADDGAPQPRPGR